MHARTAATLTFGVHCVDVRVPLRDVLLQFTPMLYFWRVVASASFFPPMRNSPVDNWVTGQHVQIAFGLCLLICHLQFQVALNT